MRVRGETIPNKNRESPILSFIPDISIASPSPPLLRGTPDYSVDTVLELTRQSATGNRE